jgi:hypothetical protein
MIPFYSVVSDSKKIKIPCSQPHKVKELRFYIHNLTKFIIKEK